MALEAAAVRVALELERRFLLQQEQHIQLLSAQVVQELLRLQQEQAEEIQHLAVSLLMAVAVVVEELAQGKQVQMAALVAAVVTAVAQAAAAILHQLRRPKVIMVV